VYIGKYAPPLRIGKNIGRFLFGRKNMKRGKGKAGKRDRKGRKKKIMGN
jgi:hypothetical protein